MPLAGRRFGLVFIDGDHSWEGVTADISAHWPEAVEMGGPQPHFLAYRAYVSQRHERSKLESLYEATRTLHRSPQIETALVAACPACTRYRSPGAAAYRPPTPTSASAASAPASTAMPARYVAC